ncbi:MAG: hypothetical protein GC202_02665 [Alphaproteobacteria bacterium]|nr:hypothetical protein [Alphaproteobacteria bacterium]
MTVQSVDPKTVSPQIRAALAGAAGKSGGPAAFAELLATARRESGLKADATNPHSSATGLFQFTEQTWLDLVSRKGAAHGLGALAGQIGRDPTSGKLEVASPEARQKILALRKDPKVAAAMARELSAQNRKSLATALGREPTYQELYAAHFLGARGAARLIHAAEESPETPSNRLMPVAAKANRAVFRDAEAKRFRTAGELARHLDVANAAQDTRETASGAEYLDGIASVRGARPVQSAQFQAQVFASTEG